MERRKAMQSIQSLGRGNREGLLFRGIIAIIFGILALVWPGITLAILILLFGAYAIIDGIFDIVTAARGSAFQSRELLLVEGIVSVIAGGIAFVWPGITALVFLYLLAAWAVVTGVMEVVAAFSSNRSAAAASGAPGVARTQENDWWLAIAGVASIIFGILVGLQPRFGLLSVIWILGIYALVFGVLFLLRFFQSLAYRRAALEGGSVPIQSQSSPAMTMGPMGTGTNTNTNTGMNQNQTRTPRHPNE
jgi:uncharacterized membrane protein HdeD (DUF308 family)